MSIHPSAVVHPRAEIDPSVHIGPFCVVDEDVVMGPGCVLDAFVHIHSGSLIGPQNHFHAHAVIGDAPQDLKFSGDPTRLRIGARNVFREGFTAHRSNTLEEDTVIGDDGFFMANSHVGHNSVVGDHTIVANGALIGGHVTVGDRAFISGNVAIHQFTRIGRLSLSQGNASISTDLPPFCIATGLNRLCGLNRVGLMRAGVDEADRTRLRQVYRRLFYERRPMRRVIDELRANETSAFALELLDFVANSQRGVAAHR